MSCLPVQDKRLGLDLCDGPTVVKPAHDMIWGHGGNFADLDGYY